MLLIEWGLYKQGNILKGGEGGYTKRPPVFRWVLGPV